MNQDQTLATTETAERLAYALTVARDQFDERARSDAPESPGWLEAFSCFYESSDPVDQDSASFLRGITNTAQRLVPYSGGNVARVPVTDAAYRGMVEDLARRVLEVCESVLTVELLAQGKSDGEWTDLVQLSSSSDVWLARIEAYPGLAFVIGTACDQWRVALVEMMERWRRDQARICATWSDSLPAGTLTSFSGGAGDRHNGGRSVALLRFASGLGVAYKPKNLELTAATLKLFERLNVGSAEPLLPVRGVLCAEGYGWEELVEAAPVDNVEEFEVFYRRLGALTRVLQYLGARDMWADNLVADGAQPHFVDLECVLYAPLDDDSPEWSLTVRAEQTVVRTAIPLAASSPGFGIHAPDVGCLSHAGDPRSQGGGGVPLGRYRPWNKQETADPWEFADAVLEGYREGDALLRSHQDVLLDPEGPLAALKDAPVRFIARSTWEYQRFLRGYLDANALADAAAWLALDSAVTDAATNASDRAKRVADSEARSLRNLDIPYFTTIASRGDLYTSSGDVLPGTSLKTAWDDLGERTATLHEFPLEAEEAVLRCAIDAARGGAPVAWTARHGESTTTNGDLFVSPDRVHESLAEIIAILLNARRPPLGDGAGWLGLTWSPTHGVFHVGPAGADLAGGSLGPALLLAEYASWHGDDVCAATSRAVLESLDAATGSFLATRLEARFELNAWPLGGLAGPGALMHVAARSASLFSDATLIEIVRRQLDRAKELIESSPYGLGLATGLAGLQAQLIDARAVLPALATEIDGVIRFTSERLMVAFLDPSFQPEPPEMVSRLDGLMPVGRDGMAVAIAKCLASTPQLIDAETARSTLKSHRYSLSSIGGVLASLSSKPLPSVTTVLPQVRLSTATSTERLIALATVRQRLVQLDDDEHRVESDRVIRALLNRREASGRWFPDRLVDDRLHLSALNGLAALGRVLLRHVEPSLRVLSMTE